MKGFKSKGACYANGGMVRGPGTGTSDSVKDAVPPGTFIMPADSTEKIGAEQLAGMGFKAGRRPAQKRSDDVPIGFQPMGARKGAGSAGKVPVNLSSGEFKLSPGQVHAIGAEVLEDMKEATHTPTGETPDHEAGEMEVDHVSRPALNFADGGLVDDRKKRSMATSPSNTYPGNQAEAAGNIYAKSNAELADGARQVGGFVANAFPGTVVATQGAGKAVRDAYEQGGLGAAVGQGIRGSMVPAVGFADDVMGGVKRVLDPAAQALKTFVTGDATPIGQEPATASPAQSPATAPTPVSPATTSAPTAAANPNYGNEPNAPANTNRAVPAPAANNVTREGNSYSGQNVGLGFTINGQEPRNGGYVAPGASSSGVGGPDVMGILQRESQIRAGMGELQDQINFNGGNGIGFRKTTNDEIVRDMLVNGNSRDRASALGFMAGGRDAAAKQGLDQQEMALRQQQQSVANADFGLRREAAGFQTRAAKRQEELQAKYEAAKTPEERSAIAQQIRDLGGKEFPNRFTVVPGGQEVDPTTNQLVTRPARVINNQTGQFVDQPQAAAPQPVANHIAALKKNPEQAAMFDSVYGKGAAARYLGAGNGS